MTSDTLSHLERLANDALCDAAAELWPSDPFAGYQDLGYASDYYYPFSPDILQEEYEGSWDNAVAAYELR